jgi:hypothetical protein
MDTKGPANVRLSGAFWCVDPELAQILTLDLDLDWE